MILSFSESLAVSIITGTPARRAFARLSLIHISSNAELEAAANEYAAALQQANARLSAAQAAEQAGAAAFAAKAVSYTHLDVYKRQPWWC